MHAALIIILVGCSGSGPPKEASEGTTDDTGTSAACAGADWSGDAAELALPAGYPVGTFTSPEGGTGTCVDDAGPATWWREDLTGDGIDDLVVTRVCGDEDVGDSIWLVHPAESGGFGQAISWTLPSGLSTDTFLELEGDDPRCEYGALVPAYHLRDMDGDGLADLVTTKECIDTTVGSTHWNVYPNTGSGFGSAVSWPLPDGFSTDTFTGRSGREVCEYGENSPTWAVLDLDGDSLPDIVTTNECVDAVVGVGYWHLWRNEGNGFSGDAEVWDLPTGVWASKLEEDDGACEYGYYQPAYFLEDMDGDGAPDLVSPFDCLDLDVGVAYWNVFAGTGAGFEDIRVQWRLPDGYAVDTFGEGGQVEPSCDAGIPAFELRDVDADARPDLVVTADCDASTLGDTHWRVHVNEGERFASAPVEAPLPLGRSAYAFQPPAPSAAACSGAGDRPAWSLWDTDADGRDDFVLTEACDDTSVGEARWLVHRGACHEE